MQATRYRGSSANGIKRKPVMNCFSSFIIAGSILLAFSLFGYFFAHTHLTLGQYDKEIKFIRNKFQNIAKSSIQIPLQGFQHYQNLSLVDHGKHLIDSYEIANPVRKLISCSLFCSNF